MTTANLNQLSIAQLTQALAAKQQNQIVYPEVNEKGTALMTIDNFRTVIMHYGIDIKYNSMSKQNEIVVPNFSADGDLYNNAIIGQMLSMFHAKSFPIAKDRLMDFVNVIAHENQYHPVKDWIDSQVWDGKSRLQDFYDSIILQTENPMKEVIMRKWALSLVAALYHKNFSCEGVLTLTGAQGIGKTTWVEELLPQEGRNVWNKDSVIIDMKNKDTLFKALSKWVVELGELDATFRKSDMEALKGFLTEKTDNLRSPYDRVANTYPRKTIFYASVNSSNFLMDDENRRFWVLAVKSFQHGVIDPGQFWAEIKAMYIAVADKITSAESRKQNNEWGWFMSPKEREEMKPIQETFKNDDPIEQTLQRYLKPADANNPRQEWMNVTEILDRAGWQKPNKRDLNVAGKWLRQAGYEINWQKKWLAELMPETAARSTAFNNSNIDTTLLERVERLKRK